MPIYPHHLLPLSDTQPFSKNDAYTFLERLNIVSEHFNDLGKDFEEFTKNATAIINLLNGRKGGPAPLQIDLSHGSVDVQIPMEYPINHDYWIVVHQGSAGGNTITLPANVSGRFTVDPAPNSITPIKIIALGDDKYMVDESIMRTHELIQSINTALLQKLKDAHDELETATAAMRKNIEDANAHNLAERNKLGERVAEGERKVAQLSQELRTEVAEKVADIESRMTSLQSKITGDMSALDKKIGERTTAEINTFKTQVARDIETAKNEALTRAKSVNFNVKDYGAKGDGVTDDTTAIRNCVEAGGRGAHIYFPQGHYLISGTISMIMGQLWSGTAMNNDDAESLSGSHIKATHDGVAIDIPKNNSADLARLKIYGPGATSTNSIGVQANVSQCTLRDVSIWDFNTGFAATENWYCVLDRVSTMYCYYGMKLTYCYNMRINEPRILPKRRDKVNHYGIYCTERCMLSVTGGSIEDYKVGIYLGASSDLYISGTYFESLKDDINTQPPVAIHVPSNNYDVGITAIGCQVYMTDHEAFIDMGQANAGDKLVSFGNKFVCTRNTPGFIYRVAGSDNISVTLLGDSVAQATGHGLKFINDIGGLPATSIIATPLGMEGGDTLKLGAPIKLSTRYANGIPALELGTMDHVPSLANMPGGWSNQHIGAMVYFTNISKIGIWNGASWTDFSGAIIPAT